MSCDEDDYLDDFELEEGEGFGEDEYILEDFDDLGFESEEECGNEESDKELNNLFIDADDDKFSRPEAASNTFKYILSMQKQKWQKLVDDAKGLSIDDHGCGDNCILDREKLSHGLEVCKQAGEHFSSKFHVLCRRIFKTLSTVINLDIRRACFDHTVDHYTELLSIMEHIPVTEKLDCLQSILEFLPIPSLDELSVIYNNATECQLRNKIRDLLTVTLSVLDMDTEWRVWFPTCMNLCRILIAQQDVASVHQRLRVLRDKLKRNQEGSNKNWKSDILGNETMNMSNFAESLKDSSFSVELDALEVRLCSLTKNATRMKEILLKQQETLTVADPRNVSVIREYAAKMYMEERNWDKANALFIQAFQNYQETGNTTLARHTLKYVLLTGILSTSNIDILESHEAKIYSNDPCISFIRQLRSDYDVNDIRNMSQTIEQCVQYPEIRSDEFFYSYLQQLLSKSRLKYLQSLLSSYSKIRIEYLSKVIRVGYCETLQLCQQLSASGVISLLIDDVTGFITVHHPYTKVGSDIDSHGDKKVEMMIVEESPYSQDATHQKKTNNLDYVWDLLTCLKEHTVRSHGSIVQLTHQMSK